MAGSKWRCIMVHQQVVVHYYNNGEAFTPTPQEKIGWAIFGTPEHISTTVETTETQVDCVFGLTKRAIDQEYNLRFENGKYEGLPSIWDTGSCILYRWEKL